MTTPAGRARGGAPGHCSILWARKARRFNAALHKNDPMPQSTAVKSCEEVQTFLMDYLDNELPAMESLLIRLHILLCAACRRYMGRYKDSTALAKKILDDPPPPELVNLSVEFLRKRVPGGFKQPAQ